MAVSSLVVGGVTSIAGNIGAEVGAGVDVRAKVSTSSDLSSATFSDAVTADADGWVIVPVTALLPSTTYHYGLELDGVMDADRGQFTTMPKEDVAASFTVAHATCSDTGSNARLWDAVRARNPLMFIHLGDIHYLNIATADASLFQGGLRQAFQAARQALLWAQTPLQYLYDDHDFGPDNSNRTSVTRATAAAVYRQCVPHYELEDAASNYQAFTIGRVRFIHTDLRYDRDPDDTTDSASKTMLGATQKAWLKAEMLAAKDRPLTVWINTQVWFMDPPFTGVDTDGDHWGGFSYERAEIADYMATNAIDNVIVVSGDAHMSAYKLNVDYSTAQTAPMHQFHAGSVDKDAITRGSGWDFTEAVTGPGQYGTLSVADDGTTVDVTWRAYRVDASTGAEDQRAEYSWRAAGTGSVGDGSTFDARARVATWDGSAWVQRPVYVSDGVSFTRRHPWQAST